MVSYRFIGAGLWGGKDPDLFPELVPVQRVPQVGELLSFPDEDIPEWEIVEVIHDYVHGLHYEPTVRIICKKVSTRPQLED